MKPAPSPARPLALLQILLVTGALAVLAGAVMVIQPDGTWLRLPIELLDHTPFETYRVPGVILAILIGGTQLAAGIAVLQRKPNHLRHAAMAAAVLGAWIAGQALLAGVVWIQFPCFLVAVVELMLVGAAVPRADGKTRKGKGTKRAR